MTRRVTGPVSRASPFRRADRDHRRAFGTLRDPSSDFGPRSAEDRPPEGAATRPASTDGVEWVSTLERDGRSVGRSQMDKQSCVGPLAHVTQTRLAYFTVEYVCWEL